MNTPSPLAARALQVLIVDDEPLARARLRALLGQCAAPAAVVAAEAGHAAEAYALLAAQQFDVVLLDIGLPGEDGIAMARFLHRSAEGPAVLFVTAHPAHAVTAFELDVVDYLVKPVRIKRLQQALHKAERWLTPRGRAAAQTPVDVLVIQDRGRTERVPLSAVLHIKSELKYLSVRTATCTHIFDGTLDALEERYSGTLLRVHRNALVARSAIYKLERYGDGENGQSDEGWALRLAGIDEPIGVSRRQLAAVREVLRS